MTRVAKRVLIVDDGSTMRRFYRSVLEGCGFEVEEAINGLEGLERAMSSAFDLAVVDVNMPKMDGYTMIRRLREDPALRALPVITITTESEAHDMERAREAGSNLYFVKPADPARLGAAAKLMMGLRA